MSTNPANKRSSLTGIPVGRRFATFKLIYTEDTPADYEPPTFMAGDVDKNKWFFTTHGRNEHPENWRIGGINSGHHA